MLLFSNKKNNNKLLGLIVHVSDNVSSIECVSLQLSFFKAKSFSSCSFFSSDTSPWQQCSFSPVFVVYLLL